MRRSSLHIAIGAALLLFGLAAGCGGGDDTTVIKKKTGGKATATEATSGDGQPGLQPVDEGEVATVEDVRNCLVKSGFTARIETLPDAPPYVEERVVSARHPSGDRLVIAPIGDEFFAKRFAKGVARPGVSVSLTEDGQTVVWHDPDASDTTRDAAESCSPTSKQVEVGGETVELEPGERICSTYTDPGDKAYAPHEEAVAAKGIDCATAERYAETIIDTGPPKGWTCGASGIACQKGDQSFRVIAPLEPECNPGYIPAGRTCAPE